MVRLRTFLIGLALLTASCGSVVAAQVPPAAASDPLVLRVEQVGGFVAPATNYARIPSLSVYADGRVIRSFLVPGPYPGSALPSVEVRRISPADVQRLAARARGAGVGTLRDFGTPGIADATSTRFTVSGRTSEVYALSESTGAEAGLTPRQRTGRARMRSLLTALEDLPSTLGADAVGRSQPYRPAAVAALNSPWSAGSGGTGPVPNPAVAWPGAALPGHRLSFTGLSCVTSTGPAAARVLAVAATAHPQTPWTYHGRRYAITLRPLLPDEHGCADLGR